VSNGSYVPYERNSIHPFKTDTSLYTRHPFSKLLVSLRPCL